MSAMALPIAAVAAGGAGTFQPTQVSVTPDRSAGLQAFASAIGPRIGLTSPVVPEFVAV